MATPPLCFGFVSVSYLCLANISFLRSIRLLFAYFADQLIYFLPHIHFRSFAVNVYYYYKISVMADQVTSVPSEGIKSLTARSNDVLKSVEFRKKSSTVNCRSNTFSRLLAAGEDRKGPV